MIFNGHLGEQFNDVGTPARAASIPTSSGTPGRAASEMTVDIFAPDWNVWDWVERDLEELRREWNVTPRGVTAAPETACYQWLAHGILIPHANRLIVREGWRATWDESPKTLL